jgi:hypothetical protein
MISLMKTLKLALFAAICIFMTSCYSVTKTYEGNTHEQALGKTKNEILRSYGIPDRTTDDGAGGTVLIFEQFKQTTVTNSSTQTMDRSRTNASTVFGKKGVLQLNDTQGGQISNTNAVSETTTTKDYCYLFLDPENVVYDFKTNYGAIYKTNRCFDKFQTWLWVGVSCIFVYPPIITVPIAIISQTKAKRKGELCK